MPDAMKLTQSVRLLPESTKDAAEAQAKEVEGRTGQPAGSAYRRGYGAEVAEAAGADPYG